MSCNKCKKDDCGGQCAMERAFSTSDDRLLFSSTGLCKSLDFDESLSTVDKLADFLPDVDYILDNIVNYMFTSDLTVESNANSNDKETITKDKKLYDYLYSTNFNGQSNLDVLKQVAKGYRKYGYYGLYDTGEGLVGIDPRNIVAVEIQDPKTPVLKRLFTYLISSNQVTKGNRDRFGGIQGAYSEKDITRILSDPERYKNEVLVVTKENFSCVRLDTSKTMGESPLLKDRKRVELIINILDRMNYDISRNGIGTIALQAKDTLEEQIQESVDNGSAFSGETLLDTSRTASSERAEKIRKGIEEFAEKLSETEFNDAIVYSGNFQNLKQLERDTKSTDFLDFLSQYTPAIICQLFGVPARLFDLNKTVSNIGTYSIIDNAMKNTIIPMRNSFLHQCTPVLKHATGFDNVQFSSYEFTNNYNYNNDIYILEIYKTLLDMGLKEKAEAYLKKNLIV